MKRHPKFERSLKVVLKRHCRKNPRARAEILDVVEGLASDWEQTGGEYFCDRESFPHGHARAGLTLCKARFVLDHLRGDAAFFRVLWITDQERQIVVPFYAYTHVEHRKQPPAKELQTIIADAVDLAHREDGEP